MLFFHHCRGFQGLSIDEVIGQAFRFFVAGYDNTETNLHYILYALATNPDVQDKLIDEIDSVLGKEEPNYENISRLEFLDCVVKETLRMFPPAIAIDREVRETVVVKGVTLARGAFVMIPIYDIHHNPEYHHEPEKFKPERFDSEGKMDPFTFIPFGFGPRNSIGIRLAVMEVKMALVHILRKVRFIKTEDTPEQLPFRNFGILTPRTPIKLRVQSRISVAQK